MRGRSISTQTTESRALRSCRVTLSSLICRSCCGTVTAAASGFQSRGWSYPESVVARVTSELDISYRRPLRTSQRSHLHFETVILELGEMMHRTVKREMHTRSSLWGRGTRDGGADLLSYPARRWMSVSAEQVGLKWCLDRFRSCIFRLLPLKCHRWSWC